MKRKAPASASSASSSSSSSDSEKKQKLGGNEEGKQQQQQQQQTTTGVAAMRRALMSDTPIWHIWLSQHQLPSVGAALDVGIFEQLGEKQAMTLEELRAACGLGERGAHALLAVLCALELLVKRAQRFYLTPLGNTYLLSKSRFSWGAMLMGDKNDGVHKIMLAALRQDAAIGAVADWESGTLSSAKAQTLTAAFHAHSLHSAQSCAATLKLGDNTTTHVLDVAGGSGCFAMALVHENPKLRATVLDLPVVLPFTRHYIGDLKARVDTVAIDMFGDAPWPQHSSSKYDAVFMSNVLHDWTAAQNALLLRKAFELLPVGGTIHLHEMLLRDDLAGPLSAALFSMHMLIFTRGRQFSFAQLAKMLCTAGFSSSSVRVVQTTNLYSVVSATKT
jgi:acetylserotonin N-methyltransferase